MIALVPLISDTNDDNDDNGDNDDNDYIIKSDNLNQWPARMWGPDGEWTRMENTWLARAP